MLAVNTRKREKANQQGSHLLPEESPVVLIGSHVSRSRSITLISLTSAVGSTVVLVVLVINFENSKGLLAGDACVVGAFSGLDGVGGLGSCVTLVSLDNHCMADVLREHAGLCGYWPLVLLLAGSRVALTAPAMARREVKVAKGYILNLIC